LSSILDSLKKLERETSQQDYPPARARADRKGIIPKSAIWIVGVVCVCIGAIGFAAYFRGAPEKSHKPLVGDITPAQKTEVTRDDQKIPLAHTNETPSPATDSARNRKTTATAREPETLSSVGKPITNPRPSEEKDNKAEVKTEKRQIVEVKKIQKEKQVVDRAVQKPQPQIVTKEKDKPDSSDESPEKTLTQENKPIPMDRLEGVEFKIQAISWGETHRERLVVISNQVLREGDGIKGYQISHINPDDVVLRRGGKDYRLGFRSAGRP